MTNPITTLTCPSCGSRLSIVKGVDRFACGHCGNEHIVKRESGIVYLEPIAEDIRHIRTGVDNLRGGVDKTAAELAIARLTRELGELEGQLEATKTGKPQPSSTAERALLVASFISLLIMFNNGNLWYIFAFCLVAFLCARESRGSNGRKTKKVTIENLEASIKATRSMLARNRALI